MAYAINLSKEETVKKINLSKDKLKICLEKKDLTGEKARVAFIIDTSGSMYDYFISGKAQNIIERILPLALEFDDNSELDMFQFSNYVEELESVTMKNIYKYVDNEIMPYFMGNATYYAPALEEIYDKYVIDEPSKEYPTYVLFLTDGENFDESATEEIVQKLSYYNVFIQFIGIGDEEFEFLEELDNISGRYIDNANFFSVNDINNISDEQLYQRLMKEYPDWLKLAREKGLVCSLPNHSNKSSNGKNQEVTLDKSNSKTIQKGQKVSLSQNVKNLSKLLVGIQWEIINKTSNPMDIDVSIFMMDVNKKTEDRNVIFYNNTRSTDGGVEIKADHGTGLKNIFKDMVQLDLNKVPQSIERLAFTITIDEAKERNQTFKMLSNAHFKIIDAENKCEVFNYRFDENLTIQNALVIGEIYRYKNEWKLSPEGNGFTDGLKSLCENYGVEAN